MNVTNRAQVRAAQKEGLRVSLWPGHTLEDYQLGIALGADVLCTDIPLKLTEWLKSQKQQQ
jgi:glycerophosphoryl diester phosphodiesterase